MVEIKPEQPRQKNPPEDTFNPLGSRGALGQLLTPLKQETLAANQRERAASRERRRLELEARNREHLERKRAEELRLRKEMNLNLPPDRTGTGQNSGNQFVNNPYPKTPRQPIKP